MTQPQQPLQVSEFARACLSALAVANLGHFISLGGAFGLAHYLEYRSTSDVDAWWVEPVTREDRQQVIATVGNALGEFGSVNIRAWGDVQSVELAMAGKTIFSFQIARRSAELHGPVTSPWPGDIWLDSLEDLIASKMVALVERGAPRDFRDVYTLCQNRLTDVSRCWALWAKRQMLADEDAKQQRAVIAIQTHLARIEQARPLNQIVEAEQRLAAEQLRAWFRTEFLHDFSS